MTREQLVEKIARACCEANGQDADAFLASGTEAEWTFYVVDAIAALSAIEAAGLRIVPHKLLVEAHACMRETGWQLAPASVASSSDGVLECAVADIEERFAALINASPVAAKEGE